MKIKEAGMDNRASILVITLWSLFLLGMFAIHLGYNARQKIEFVKILNSRDNLYFIAEAGVKRAIVELNKKEPSEYDVLNEAWGNNPGIFQEVGVGYGTFDVCYSYLDYHSGRYQTRYGLIDEERKVNLNKAELDVIQRLIMIVVGLGKTEAQGLAAAIIDWRDKDSGLLVPEGSAEDRYYRNLPNPYEAKDADFEVFDELLLVRGVSQELLEKIENYVTIYGDGRININTAGVEVLLALDLGIALVDKIISFRCGEDGIEANSDDNIFSSPNNITAELASFAELSIAELTSLHNLVSRGKLSTNSSNFMVRSIARLDNRQLETISIINREGEILSWRQQEG
ncbi:MAG: hypothetical protein ABIC18_04800 [Candidatus Omnitrophota bacterium]